MDFSDIARRIGKLAADNSPAILTAIGVTGAVTTAFLTGKASFKAAEILRREESMSELEDCIVPPLDPKRKVELTWRLYIPAVSTGLLTVVCIIGANRVSDRRAAALASAYSLTQRAFQDYRAKVVDKIGETKESQVRSELAKERIEKAVGDDTKVLVVATGKVLCHDDFSGRVFESSIEEIKHAVNRVNHQINRDGYASLNDFYAYVGLPSNDAGEEVGWNGALMEVAFDWTGINGQPAVSIYFPTKPVRKYYKFG